MKLTKRIIALSLTLATCLSLAACGKPGSTSTSKSAGTSTSTSTSASKSETKKTWDLPDDITLTIGIPNKTNVLDWEDNELTKWIEAETGYNLEFELYASSDSEAKKQVITQMTSGEKLPDLILDIHFNMEQREQYGPDGYFYDMSELLFDPDYLEQFCEYDFWGNWTKNLTGPMREMVDNTILSPDGSLYGFPYMASALVDQVLGQAWINQTWLDKLGLKMPTNLDELYDVLTAFVTKDPNGNGVADEIGMLGRHAQGTYNSAPNWIINHYGPSGSWFYSIDQTTGDFVFSRATEDYREGVKAMRKFAEAGLLHELNWTISTSERDALCSPADGLAKIGVICGYIIQWDKEASSIHDQYTYLAPFGGYVETKTPVLRTASNFISADCKYPEAALDVLMTIASPEGICRQRYGVPGVDWHWGTDVTDGTPVCVTDTDAYSGQTKQTWGQETVRICWALDEGEDWKDPNPCVAGVDVPVEQQTHTQKRLLKHYEANFEYMRVHKKLNNNYENTKYRPYIQNVAPMTAKEAAASAAVESPASSYINSTCNDFMTGKLDINDDAVWNNYIKTLEEMGTKDTCLKINKEAYERSLDIGKQFNDIIKDLAGVYKKA